MRKQRRNVNSTPKSDHAALHEGQHDLINSRSRTTPCSTPNRRLEQRKKNNLCTMEDVRILTLLFVHHGAHENLELSNPCKCHKDPKQPQPSRMQSTDVTSLHNGRRGQNGRQGKINQMQKSRRTRINKSANLTV